MCGAVPEVAGSGAEGARRVCDVRAFCSREGCVGSGRRPGDSACRCTVSFRPPVARGERPRADGLFDADGCTGPSTLVPSGAGSDAGADWLRGPTGWADEGPVPDGRSVPDAPPPPELGAAVCGDTARWTGAGGIGARGASGPAPAEPLASRAPRPPVGESASPPPLPADFPGAAGRSALRPARGAGAGRSAARPSSGSTPSRSAMGAGVGVRRGAGEGRESDGSAGPVGEVDAGLCAEDDRCTAGLPVAV
ncbi:hypothetical protein BX283_0912 [Streptomyces sp. TLI_146]|nr:hypothetical protein BX283_0912 [Streptomyces sp. TLI_146]